jgi:hypothetical protein
MALCSASGFALQLLSALSAPLRTNYVIAQDTVSACRKTSWKKIPFKRSLARLITRKMFVWWVEMQPLRLNQAHENTAIGGDACLWNTYVRKRGIHDTGNTEHSLKHSVCVQLTHSSSFRTVHLRMREYCQVAYVISALNFCVRLFLRVELSAQPIVSPSVTTLRNSTSLYDVISSVSSLKMFSVRMCCRAASAQVVVRHVFPQSPSHVHTERNKVAAACAFNIHCLQSGSSFAGE